jgi:hypothetical protein
MKFMENLVYPPQMMTKRYSNALLSKERVRNGRVSKMVEHLPSKHKALSSNPLPKKKKKKKR